ncbi:MAG: diguanylate cyclase/phosphodiesterase (GGDEF & EAL domains) with PAS/PAC sensor(s) [uncultured Rubrobacteraceae bacterium]|uniref:Diguanylate cyclase/phosphodiesterase (GGDEF & EAL domains) with PAS/PAC sensor(S) n=1 Tax=uncultured Rubrobacteraceae bacterium TaxID=349277 RepID=A0A6J4PY18_9ACTN|nr:MAG: diguanylate cyclase/phosphodiesterase (GGDEF & EAL domains) with PAS/PAC sensor(s) [uncultured Rubrobacteraceae bacterium]
MSERERIEEALRNSQELYRSLYEDNPFMYFTLDAQGTVLSVNRYGAEQLGFSVEELLGYPILDVFHEGDKENVSRSLDECLREPGQTCGWEACKVRKDGSTLWVRETVRAVRSPVGDTVVLVVCEDITERKLAEEALQESNSRIRSILESITDAFFALDSEWRFTYVNSEAERVLQRTREELLGKNVWEEFPEAVGSAFYREYHRAFHEQTRVEFEEYYPPLKIWVDVCAYPSEDGLSVYFRDATERRQAEERLLFQAQLLEQVKAGVIATDLEGKVIHWNDYAEKLYGWSREEALGRNVAELVVGPAEAGDADEIMEQLRAGEMWEGEFFVRRKDGSTFPAHVTNSLIYDSQGRAVGIVGVSMDIAKRKKAEEERDRLFTLSLDLLCIAGLDGYFKRINPAFEETLGYTGQELLAKPFVEFVHPEDRAATLSEVEKLSAGATTALFENRYRCKDGAYVWLAWKAVPVPEEGLIYAAARNVTAQKRAEQDIRARARQQEAVAELGRRALAEPDLSALMDESAELVARTLNLEYCEILELLPDGETLLLRSGVGWNEGLVGNATVGADLDSLVGYTLLADEPVIVENLGLESPFGDSPRLQEHGVTSGMSTVVRGREGPFGIVGAYTRDRRTFSRDDANFLQAVANVLATAVDRENAEEEMREIRRAERQRIARAMHDEALQDVVYALQEIRDAEAASGNGRQNAELREVADALRRSVEGLRSAIFDLRLDADREQTLVEMLESLVELNRRSSPEREVELSVEEGFRSPLTRTKEVELLRLVQEALVNARRHSGARRVRVAVGISGSELYAEVSDDGRGFDPAQASAGMGTKGMRERARTLGGSLEIRSKPGEGTRVRFEVAFDKDKEEPKEACILLVEDHASFRQAVASVFEQEPGFTVVAQAGSLTEARRMLGAEPIDVAIIDLALPDGYGGELIKDLRDANPGAIALVLSASLDHAQTARAVESGAAGVLHKSVELDEIVNAVRRVRAGETLLSPEEVVELLRYASSRREYEYESRQAIAQLTMREREVLQALAEGLDGPEIARRLRISIPTERNHVASILAKLGVHSRLQALVFALRHNLVSVR